MPGGVFSNTRVTSSLRASEKLSAQLYLRIQRILTRLTIEVAMNMKRSSNENDIEAVRREIISYVRTYIRENELKENDKLPSESFLTETFSTNRNTVRSALATLKAQGVIYSRQGKGFFVAERPQPLVYRHDNSLGFSEILGNGTRNFNSHVLSVELKTPTDADCEMLKITPDDPVYYLRQLRTIDGEDLAVCLSVIPARFAPDLEKYTEDFKGTNNIFLNTYHYPHPVCSWVHLEASLPTREEIELLNISENMPILQQENLFVVTGMGAIEYFKVRARGDMFHFSMEFI